MVVPNPESPTFVGERFLALAYRTTRAILIARHLLPAGSAFQELPWDTTGRVVPIDPSTPLRDAGAFLNGRPTLPDVRSSPDEIVALAKGHCLVALLLGADPDDPALHWFQEDHFEEFYPTFFEMLAYEAALLKNVDDLLKLERPELASLRELARHVEVRADAQARRRVLLAHVREQEQHQQRAAAREAGIEQHQHEAGRERPQGHPVHIVELSAT